MNSDVMAFAFECVKLEKYWQEDLLPACIHAVLLAEWYKQFENGQFSSLTIN